MARNPSPKRTAEEARRWTYGEPAEERCLCSNGHPVNLDGKVVCRPCFWLVLRELAGYPPPRNAARQRRPLPVPVHPPSPPPADNLPAQPNAERLAC